MALNFEDETKTETTDSPHSEKGTVKEANTAETIQKAKTYNKSLIVFVILALVCAFCLNLFYVNISTKKIEPPTDTNTQENSIQNPAKNIPGNYSDMGKYNNEQPPETQPVQKENEVNTASYEPYEPIPYNSTDYNSASTTTTTQYKKENIFFTNSFEQSRVKINNAKRQQEKEEFKPKTEKLMAGTVIPATLVTAITSDNLHGNIVAIVRQDIYDTLSGNKILIPAGSKIIGRATAAHKNRVNVEFERIIFPNTNSIKIPRFQGIDATGYYGLRDKYTEHRGKFFTSTAISSLLSAGVTTVGKNSSSDERSIGQEAEAGAVANMLNAFVELAKKDLDIKPTATIREGYQFNIFIVEDIELSEYKGK